MYLTTQLSVWLNIKLGKIIKLFLIFVTNLNLKFNLDKGFRINPKEVDGDWDHVYVNRGTSTAIIITKYRCLGQNGCLLPVNKWEVKSEYDIKLGKKYYRQEKLNKLLSE